MHKDLGSIPSTANPSTHTLQTQEVCNRSLEASEMAHKGASHTALETLNLIPGTQICGR
ncbi:hypothetical protein ACRRTK_018274 [Alexandromys fortis]